MSHGTPVSLALVVGMTALLVSQGPVLFAEQGVTRAPGIRPLPSAAGLLSLAEIGRLGFTVQGAGARALGMGGAFIGVADDATAASHNPAGLAQLRTFEASLVAGQQSPHIEFTGARPNLAAGWSDPMPSQGPNTYSGKAARKVEFLSFTLPAQVGGRNLVTQISYQDVFDLDTRMDHSVAVLYPTGDPLGGPSTASLREDIRQSGRLGLTTFSLAYEFSPRILAGLSYNRWSGNWIFQSRHQMAYSFGVEEGGLIRVDQRFEGQNANLGLMWRSETVRVGLTYRTGFTGTYRVTGSYDDGQGTEFPVNNPESVGLRWPWTFGVGASWRPIPELMVALDWSKTPWSQANFKASEGSSLSGRNLFNPYLVNAGTDQSPDYSAPLPMVPDTTALHVGAEYLFFWGNRILPVRVGWFREPQPHLDNVTGTTRVLRGLTLGVGVKQGPLSFDVAYKRAVGSRQAGIPTDPKSAFDLLSGRSVELGLAQTHPFIGQERITNHVLKASVIWQFKGEGLRKMLHWLLVSAD